MRVLVACEFSGRVRDAFIDQGHYAESCDLLPAEGKYPHQHHQGDIDNMLYRGWDMLIAFPPCQHLAVSGSRYFKQKQADGRQQQGIDFFMKFVGLPIPMIAIENPIGIMSTKYRKPDQIIQPYEFGHNASKKTCFWLQQLPPLKPTKCIEGKLVGGKRIWGNQTPSGQNKLGPSKDRSKIRSITYQGVADAMASQWGVL